VLRWRMTTPRALSTRSGSYGRLSLGVKLQVWHRQAMNSNVGAILHIADLARDSCMAITAETANKS